MQNSIYIYIYIKIHHSDQLVTTSKLEYKGGEVTMWYKVNVNTMMFIEFVKVEKMEYRNAIYFGINLKTKNSMLA